MFIPVPGTEPLNLWNFPSDERYKGVSHDVNKVTFGHHVRMAAGGQENHGPAWLEGWNFLFPSTLHGQGENLEPGG